MAYLNQQEREALLNEIKDKKLGSIRWTLFLKDKEARLAYFRNVQESGKWMTRVVLQGLGTQVTMVENQISKKDRKKEYELVEIIVEPTADNRL